MLELTLSEIKKIEGLVYQDDSYISLSQGALRVGGIPNAIKEHVARIVQTSDITDYYKSAWGIPELRESIAQHLNELHTTNLTDQNIIISHGSIGALSALFATLAEPGAEIVIPEPAYPAYRTLALAVRAHPIMVANSIVNETWGFDLQAIEAAISDKTVCVVLSNPTNPTGNVIDEQTLEKLIAICERHNIYLICDEVYDDYLYDNTFASATPYVASSKHVIRTGSFSKNFSMSGWRIGYMALPLHLVRALGRMQDAQLNCPNVFAQHAALYALDHHDELVKPFKQAVESSMHITRTLLEPLKKQGIIWYAQPRAGFNFFIRTNHIDAQLYVRKLREEAKVTVVPGIAFGPSGRDYFRLCYARMPELTERGVRRLVDHMMQTIAPSLDISASRELR